MPAKTLEARISALERMLHGNPGTFTKSDGVSLKEHLETRLEAMDRLIAEGFAARDKALTVAWDSLKAKMIDENGVRDQLQRQADQLVGKIEYHGDIKKLSAEVQDLREYRATMEGKASQSSVYIGYIFTIVIFVISVVINLLTK